MWIDVLPCLVKSGVAQGSVLGPLLFLVMLLDIDANIKDVSVKSFADDTRLLKSIFNQSHISLLDGGLKQIYRWANENNLSFNDAK